MISGMYCATIRNSKASAELSAVTSMQRNYGTS